MSQRRKIVLFIASSLDGYIASKDESLEWLFKVEGEGDNGFTEFYQTIDTIIMGKRTYDWIIKEIEDFPYETKECYVYTRSSYQDTENVKFINEDIHPFIHNLRKKEGNNIWLVGGGELLDSFIQEDLVDEFIITIAPTIIGNGIPLFKESNHYLELSLIGTRNFNQFTALHFERKR